jgi:hypothetical protein
MTLLVGISAHECESHARTSSKPSIVYVHSEAFRTCRLQMRFMLTLATLVKDEIDLFVLDALTGKEPLAPLGITHAPALIFRKEQVRYIIEGITPVETLLAVIKSHLGINIGRREHSNERRMIPC